MGWIGDELVDDKLTVSHQLMMQSMAYKLAEDLSFGVYSEDVQVLFVTRSALLSKMTGTLGWLKDAPLGWIPTVHEIRPLGNLAANTTIQEYRTRTKSHQKTSQYHTWLEIASRNRTKTNKDKLQYCT